MSQSIDWDKLGFSLMPAKTMFVSHRKKDGDWDAGEFVPYGNISLSPAAAVLNYGQGIFEGMKVNRTKNDELVLFRPNDNAHRFAHGARQLCMPAYPVNHFVEAIKELARHNQDFVPPYGKGSLYVRPCLWGTGALLGVNPSMEHMMEVYCSPVGNYFGAQASPIKLMVTHEFQRAAPKGTGNIKFIGNYAGGLMPAKLAKARGFNGCIYLDARTEQFIEEVGTANFFCVKNGCLFTPRLGSILPGIIRESIMRLAKQVFNMDVIEENLRVEDALVADECFCTGTAATIAPVGSITYQGQEVVFNDYQAGPFTQKLYDLLTRIQLCEHEDLFGWVVKV